MSRWLAPQPAQGEAPGPEDPSAMLLDLLPTGVVLLDGDRVLAANAEARRIGVTSRERLSHGELRAAARRTHQDGRTRELEVDIREQRRTRHLRAQLVAAPGGRVALVLDDLTEARRVESMRRDFVANVSHEIKTPVGAISLLVEALQGSDDPQRRAQFLDRLAGEASRLARLVQDLLDLSRLQADDQPARTVPVRVMDAVDDAVAAVSAAAERKGITILSSGDRATVVAGDHGELVTALRNLLDNAITYSPEGTRVTIAVRTRAGRAEIAVTDQGVGIPPEDLGRVFERFYRVDPARSRATGGTGLGLAIVKHIVASHGGDVSVWSELNAGSTFTIRLPLAAPSTAGGTADASVAEVGR